ncbi:DDE-type integrase/transposase/recombinase [Paraburkholderia fungorum]|uniref:DDE-type integrase/transposase/recombinase n=1 Tax=Paraburkholderia fungorum TaxID=134537 RepID=UPI0038B8B5DB
MKSVLSTRANAWSVWPHVCLPAALSREPPILRKAFRRCKRPAGTSWRVDETYIKIKGKGKYLYRAVDKAGQTVDCLLRAQRDKAAAQRYFEKSIHQNGEAETITIDKKWRKLCRAGGA